MKKAVDRILEAAGRLTTQERAELAERILEGLSAAISTEPSHAQIAEVRRRVAQVEAGEVKLIPGDEALAHVRRSLASKQASS